MTKKRLYEKVFEEYGYENQLFKTFEELCECGEALLKFRDNKDIQIHVCEEIADAMIMLEQMALYHGPEEVEMFKKAKLERLKERVK